MWSRMAGQGTCYTFHITFTVMPPNRWGPAWAPTTFDRRIPLKIDISRWGRGWLSSSILKRWTPARIAPSLLMLQGGVHRHRLPTLLSPHVFIVRVKVPTAPLGHSHLLLGLGCGTTISWLSTRTPSGHSGRIIIPLVLLSGNHHFSITVSTVVTHTTTSCGGM